MKKQIKLTESGLNRIIYESAMRVIREYNGSDAIEDYENGRANLDGSPIEGDEQPAGFDSNSVQDVRREGSLEDVCSGHFQDIDELKMFMEELGETLAMEDEFDAIIKRIDETEGYEGEMTGW